MLFTFHESPKWLVGRGRDEEAVEVVRRVREFNRRKTWGFDWRGGRAQDLDGEEEEGEGVLTVEDLRACEREWEERKRERVEWEREACGCCDSEAIDGLPPTTPRLPAISSSSGGPSTSSTDTGKHVKTSQDDVLEGGLTKTRTEEENERGMALAKMGLGHLKMLFATWGMARLTVLTWVCYAADYW